MTYGSMQVPRVEVQTLIFSHKVSTMTVANRTQAEVVPQHAPGTVSLRLLMRMLDCGDTDACFIWLNISRQLRGSPLCMACLATPAHQGMLICDMDNQNNGHCASLLAGPTYGARARGWGRC
jgi:hypothetical protein